MIYLYQVIQTLIESSLDWFPIDLEWISWTNLVEFPSHLKLSFLYLQQDIDIDKLRYTYTYS